MEMRKIVESPIVEAAFYVEIIPLLIPVLFGALSCFVYAASSKAAMAVLSLGILFDLSLIVAWIPFFGAVIQAGLMVGLIQPWIFQFTGLYATWVTNVPLGIFLSMGIIITAIMSAELIHGG